MFERRSVAPKPRTKIPSYFAVKIYAPNEYGWEKFQRDREYWHDVPWDNLRDCFMTENKIKDYLAYLIRSDIPDSEAGNYPYEIHEKIIECVKTYYCNIVGLRTMADIKARTDTELVVDMGELVKQAQSLVRYLDLGDYPAKLAESFVMSFPTILRELYAIYSLSREEFLVKQKENFRLYIEPLAQPLVCYLLSQPGVSTYESHTNSTYAADGRRSELSNMPNGVWFRLAMSDDCMWPTAMLRMMRTGGEQYYFARLHTIQCERSDTSLQREQVALEDDIYRVRGFAGCRFPSKTFDISQPDRGRLGFDHIKELQVPPDAKETESLDVAIARGTDVARREFEARRSLGSRP